jgi:hypothetical protein
MARLLLSKAILRGFFDRLSVRQEACGEKQGQNRARYLVKHSGSKVLHSKESIPHGLKPLFFL